MSDGREHDEIAQRLAREAVQQQAAERRQAQAQRVAERVGKATLPTPPSGPLRDRRLDDIMTKISNAAGAANAVWLPTLQTQLRMGNLVGFETLFAQTKREIESAERGLKTLERKMLHDASAAERGKLENTFGVQQLVMLKQLIPVVNQLRALRAEADKAAKHGSAAAPKLLAANHAHLDFGTIAVGELSAPQTITFANTGPRIVSIGTIEVHATGGPSGPQPFSLSVADTRKAHLMPGEEMQLTLYCAPTTLYVPHTLLTVAASDGAQQTTMRIALRGAAKPHAHGAGTQAEIRNRAQQASDPIVAGAAPAVVSSADLLAAMLAAQTLTQQDTPSARRHAADILATVGVRLETLRPVATQRLMNEGNALVWFGMAADAVVDWRRQLGLGSRVATGPLLQKFQLARESLQFVLGETHDLPTTRAHRKVGMYTAAGGAAWFALPLVAGGVAAEASLLASGGRMAAQRLFAWGVANPNLALATTEMVAGFALTADPEDYTWENLCAVFSDPKAATLFVMQIFTDVMHARMAGHMDMAAGTPRRSPGTGAGGVEPNVSIPFGNRSTATRPIAPGTTEAPSTAPATAAPMQPTDADYAIVRQRVQKLIEVRDDVLRKASAPAQPAPPLAPVQSAPTNEPVLPAPTNAPVRPAPELPIPARKLPAQAAKPAPVPQPTPQELAGQDLAIDQQPARATASASDANHSQSRPPYNANQDEHLPSKSDLAQPGGLQATEGKRVRTPSGSLAPASHVLTEHGPDVPLSRLRRSVEDGTKRTNSKFIDRATMESTIADVLNSNQGQIDAWLATLPAPGKNLALNATHEYGAIGVGFQKTATGIEARYDLRSATVVIKATGPGTFVIQTAFPR